MNKTELVSAIAAKSGLTKVDSKKALDAAIEAIVEAAKKEKVAILGFGTFEYVLRAARTGINPLTKKSIKIAAKKVFKFKASSNL